MRNRTRSGAWFNPWRGLRELPRDAWIISTATLVNRAGTMVLPFLVLYLTSGLGYTAAQGGFALTVYGFGGLLSAPLSGWLSDRVGPIRVIQLSLLLAGGLLIVLPLAHSLDVVLALVLLWAVIGEAVRTASQAALLGATAPRQRKAAMALYRLAINLGMSIGPAIGGVLAILSFTLLFVIDGATSIAAAVLLAFLVQRTRASAGSERAVPRARAIGALRDRRMLGFMTGMFFLGVMFFQMEGAMPIYLVRDLGLSRPFFGLLFTLNTLLIIAFEVPLNVATADWRHRSSLILSSLIMAVGFGALAFATTRWAVAGTVVVWTFGEMMMFPVTATYVGELAPPDRQGEYMGAYWIALSLARMIGPWTGTIVLDRYGGTVVWPAVFVCGLVTAGVFALVVTDSATSRSPSAAQ